MAAEGAANDFAQRLGAVDDEQPTDRRVEPALDQIVDQRLDDCGIFGRPLDQAKRMPIAVPSMSKAVTSTRSLPICRPSFCIISRSTLDKVGCHPLGQALRRRRHEPARGRRFRGAIPAMDRQVTFGKPDSPPEFARLHVDFPAPTKAKSHTFRLRHEILSTPTAAYSSPTTFPICFA